MLVKINARGSGGGSGPTEYLTGDFGTVDGKMPTAAQRAEGVGLRSVAPVVLRGDVKMTREIIDSLSFKRRYTSGVLSFSEPNITAKAKAEIMDSWEGALFPGMGKDQYQILWVEHRDKGRLELNFLIANVDLASGKRLQPYFDKADRRRVDAWQTLTNDKHSLSDPKEPERARTLTKPDNLPKSSQEAAREITDGLLSLEVESRAEIIGALEKAGIEVSRQTKKSISVKLTPDARPLRLSGAIYGENYGGGPELQAERDRAAQSYKESRESRISEAKQRYRIGIEKRTEYLQKRYQRPEPPALDFRDIERASIARGLPDRVWPDRLVVPGRKLHDGEDLRAGRLRRPLGEVPSTTKIHEERRDPVHRSGVEHDGTRTDLAEFAESVGRRARKHTSENGRHGRRARKRTSENGVADKIFIQSTSRTQQAIDEFDRIFKSLINLTDELFSKPSGPSGGPSM